jgi:predicted nuclease of restriction endonuclease-like (RecB) superfamily
MAKKKPAPRSRRNVLVSTRAASKTETFAAVVKLIEEARARAYQSVNKELVGLYWRVGQHISRKIATAQWGDSVVDQLARHLARTMPGLRGFTRRNLFRMRQFYETYVSDKKVSPLVTQLPWTHNLLVLGQCKRPEEREFYLRQSIRERWAKRELERQLNIGLFERSVLRPPKVSPPVTQSHPGAISVFKDAYVVDFLNLPEDHTEADLHHGLVLQLRDFLIELGRDFCFVGSEYPVQVGNRDFALDLLFFHRGLNCLVAIELKVGRFEPEHLGKLNFYLEALDRDARKAHERPAIGVLLCASKDREVVEYSLSRSLTPALIAEYQTQLPDKSLLQAKLHEFYQVTADRPALKRQIRAAPGAKPIAMIRQMSRNRARPPKKRANRRARKSRTIPIIPA